MKFPVVNIAALVMALAVCALADIIPAKSYTIPSPQDSSWDSPDRPDPAVRETDAGRWVIPLREVMQRTYDVSGQKSEWVLGTSILGHPELDPMALGISSLSKRYPSKLAGLYTTRLGYDATTLTLNGENGILFEERHGTPLDTPVTDLNWERSSFDGNALRLDFRRLITDSVMLDFGVQSHSNHDSKDYTYQNVTHSPYFALGRDSTQIPFGGRNIAMNSMHIQPMLTWRFGLGKAYLKMNYLSLENADNTNHKVLLDTMDHSIRTFQTSPYTIDIKAVTYGAGFEVYPSTKLTFSTDFQYGTHEIEEDSLPTILRDTATVVADNGIVSTNKIYYDTTTTLEYETILGNFGLGYKTLLNPTLKFSYEFLNADDRRGGEKKEYFQDREVGYLQLADTIAFTTFRVQAGMQRNSSLLDKQDYAPAYSTDATVFLPFHFRLNGNLRHDNKFPDINQIKIYETGRLSFPNEDLKFEKRNRYAGHLGWHSREVFYGLGLRYEKVENLMRPYWVKKGSVDSTISYKEYTYFDKNVEKTMIDTIVTADSIETLYRWANIDEANTLDWILQVGFRLGNWKFYLERGQVINRSKKLIDTPELYYKGSIHWQNRFVKDRLGVSVRVDWQWFNNRMDCTINERGNPELVELSHYLALDFEARMQILSFELYTRIENFNHSIYMPEAGYTPEGLRFAYGIVWTFGN
ncbi:hypothetical protein [Fibrobacter sp.]|uniref:hypothetical protein n=1 Tax=Fibrobacter sp. TaxID=35828 RepID=UPI0025BD640A|nr:hypothetical protein [Fibrobacter sp.]